MLLRTFSLGGLYQLVLTTLEIKIEKVVFINSLKTINPLHNVNIFMKK